MKMNRLGLLFLALFLVIAPIYAIDLIPQPVEVKLLDGSLTLTRESTIAYNQPEARRLAEMLAQKLSAPTGFSFQARQGEAGTIQLRLNPAADSAIGKEGYVLESKPQSVVISANQPAGLFYGMQTLLQLLPAEVESNRLAKANWAIPAVRITDYPRFGWRGLMLDVSRNFRSKEDVKTYIDQAARFKFNTFHWHLTDDQGWRVEIKALPKLTEVGACRVPRAGHFGERAAVKPGEAATDCGFYSQADIRGDRAIRAGSLRDDHPGDRHPGPQHGCHRRLSGAEHSQRPIDPGRSRDTFLGMVRKRDIQDVDREHAQPV